MVTEFERKYKLIVKGYDDFSTIIADIHQNTLSFYFNFIKLGF